MGSAEWILILGLIFAGIAVYLFLNAILSSNADAEQLSWANSSQPKKSKSGIINFSRPLVHQFTLQHALRIKSQNYRKRVAYRIKTGGLGRELNVDEFIGLQILWAVFFPAFCLIMNFALEMGFPNFIFFMLIPVGFYMPIMHASAMKKNRELSVRADMPFYIDLLALSVEANLDFFQAIQKIVDKAEGSNSVLAEELGIVLKDIQIGSSKDQALKEFAERLDMPEITSFVAVLIDAGRSGAPIGKVLKDQSNQMRMERFTRAEKLGARASQAMLIPMMLFIVPAVFIMVLGPMVLSFYYGRK
ncbi:MAG: type II secretion system F family protein [Bdellovibrionales bacterium]